MAIRGTLELLEYISIHILIIILIVSLCFVYRSDTDEDELKKIFGEHGTVVKFKYFEYVCVYNAMH